MNPAAELLLNFCCVALLYVQFTAQQKSLPLNRLRYAEVNVDTIIIDSGAALLFPSFSLTSPGSLSQLVKNTILWLLSAVNLLLPGRRVTGTQFCPV